MMLNSSGNVYCFDRIMAEDLKLNDFLYIGIMLPATETAEHNKHDIM